MINKISITPNFQIYKSPQPNNKNSGVSSPYQVETSLYDLKGGNVYFGALVKPHNSIEADCIQFLRKIRENRCRKFTEPDIDDMLQSLNKEKNSEEKVNVLKEIFCLECDEYGKTPNKNFLKQTLDLISGRKEDDRFAILAFAQHELNNAVKPLEPFYSLPAEKQNKLINILKDINNVTDMGYQGMLNSSDYNLEALYDTFRILVYAEDDLAKLSKQEAVNTYKVETFHTLKDSIEYFKSYNYPNENIKQKVKAAVDNIQQYFLENIL